MQRVNALQPGGYYHVYNRGVNRENIFREERNYAYFLTLYAKHITPIAETFVYCLLRNHFHLMVRIRTNFKTDAVSKMGIETDAVLKTASVLQVPVSSALASKAFNNFLNAYAKGMNKTYGRTGALFQHHFGRLPITSDHHFATLVRYIPLNPRKHGFVENLRDWPYSSYHSLTQTDAAKPDPVTETASGLISHATVLNWLGGPQGFRDFHAIGEGDHVPNEWADEDVD